MDGIWIKSGVAGLAGLLALCVLLLISVVFVTDTRKGRGRDGCPDARGIKRTAKEGVAKGP
jgi:hypothetical protein